MKASPSKLNAVLGQVRGTSFVVELSHLVSFGQWEDVEFVIRLQAGEALRVPASSCEIAALEPGLTRLTFARPEAVILGVTPQFRMPDGTRPALPAAPAYALADLFPMEEGKEVAAGVIRSNAVTDIETMAFMVRQIVENDAHTAYAKGEAIKKLGYAAMQMGTDADIEDAIRRINDFLPLIHMFSDKRGKRNPIHAVVSFIYIRQLAHLMLGQHDKSFADLRELYTYCRLVPTVPLMGSNLSRAVLTLGWILGAAGELKLAGLVFDDTVTIFRDAAANLGARRHRPFLELNVPLRSAGHAIYCKAGFRTQPHMVLGQRGALAIASGFNRVEGEAPQGRLAERLIEATMALHDHIDLLRKTIMEAPRMTTGRAKSSAEAQDEE